VYEIVQTASSVKSEGRVTEEFRLEQNYPNPFNPVTTIRYSLPDAGPAQLYVYDVAGRLVTRLVDGTMPAGRHQVQWDASGLASGLYFYRLQYGSEMSTKSMILLK